MGRETVIATPGGLLGDLETAAALFECGQQRKSLDFAFEKIDALLRQGYFDSVDFAVRDFHFDVAPIDLCVLILMATKPAAQQVTHREHARRMFKHRLESEARDQAEADRVARIVRWL